MITGVSRILSASAHQASTASPPAKTGQKASQRPYPTRSRGVLSNQQKARLAILARQAFEFAHGRVPADQAEADAWRHEQVSACTGKPGLTACTQQDYKQLEAWFCDRTLQPFAAQKARERYETEPERVAMAKLQAECAARGLALSYPAAICRKQYKCELAEASAPQLWRLVFTVKNRRPSAGSATPSKKPPQADNEPF